jgi:predicted transcriptional regulator
MSKKIVISTHVPPETVERIAQAVEATGISRYTWLAQAVTEKLEREAVQI